MTVKKAKTTKKTKNAWQLTTIPVHSWITFWVLVLATMALATVCFTDAFKNSKGEVDQESVEAFKAIQQSLEQQVADLQEKASAPTQPQGRLQVMSGQISSNEACDLEWNTATATEYITWKDEKTGLTAELPYNFAWGNESYAFAPYEDVNTELLAINFGPGKPGGACGVSRDAFLGVTSSTNASTALNELRVNAESIGITGSIRQRTVSGMTVLSYTIGELGGGPVWEAFGRNYHYTIYSHGWLTDAEAVKIIQSLRVEN